MAGIRIDGHWMEACPFCRSLQLELVAERWEHGISYRVACHGATCHATGPETETGQPERDAEFAVWKWNQAPRQPEGAA